MPPTPLDATRRRKQLRVATEAARRERVRAPHRSANADPVVVDLTATPYRDVADAHDRLVALHQHFEACEDRRAVFLAIYARTTAAIADRIDRGGFEDPDWVRAYLVAFADLYRRAVHADETGARDAVPGPWRLAFDAARDETCLVLQDAALGVNAHINYDLALALDHAGLVDDRARRRADHDAVIDVIQQLVDETQHALADRDADGLAALDDALGNLDEWLTVFTIDECRDSAWRTAVAMNSRFRLRRRLAHWFNDVTATGTAHLIHATHVSDRLHDTLVDLENGTGQN
jgi:hypothetical protein